MAETWKGPEEWAARIEAAAHQGKRTGDIIRAAMEQVRARIIEHFEENWERNMGQVLAEARSLDLDTGEVRP